MVTKAENETLVRVGRGTPMGDLMRRYWHPVATSAQLPGADCAPLKTMLLGERFVVFRDSQGRVGMFDELCMHRGASLALGRVEDGGITCLYHGWKFAVDGTILETPNNADGRLRQRLKAPAYDTIERSGLIWAYIGPKELKRDSFSIFFRGPADVLLPQRMYDLIADRESLPHLFIVPVGREAKGYEYEAVFT